MNNSNTSLIIGSDKKGKDISLDGYQHIMLMAPTGAGKGVSFVLPNLLSYQESVIVHDIKGENFEITSGWRNSQGQKIFKFDPLNSYGKTHCYNPLDYLSHDHNLRLNEISKMAEILMPNHHCSHSKHAHEHNGARYLFAAITLYLLATPSKTKSLGEIYRIVMGDVTKELKSALEKAKLDSHTKMLINNFLSQSDKVRAKIVANLAAHLEIWGNPSVDKATEKSDFNPANFKKELSSLYIVLHPSDINYLKPLMQFFYQHIAQILAHHGDEKEHGVTIMLDEFTTLGKMPLFVTMIPYFRGYKIRLCLVAQDLNSLQLSYCENTAYVLLNNCTYKIMYSTNDFSTAIFASEISDEEVVPEDLMCMPKDKQLFITDFETAQITDKIVYYDKKELKDRVMKPAEI